MNLALEKGERITQATLGRCTCNHPSDLSSFTFNLTSAFASRGYPLPFLQCQNHCTPPPTLPKNKPVCPLITTYHPGLHSLRCILKESHHILLSDPSTCNLLPCPHSVTFRHPPNLSQLLVRTNFVPHPPQPTPCSFPCQRPCCKTCPYTPVFYLDLH